MDWAKALEIIVKKPWAIFVVLSAVYGYLYFDQHQTMLDMTGEIGGLRAEMAKMNEIIKLKVQLAEIACVGPPSGDLP